MSDSANTQPLVEVLGRIPSGVYILTVKHEGNETGMLATWVMQAGFDPPTVTVAIRHGRYVADWLSAGAPFALNVVAEQQKSLLRHFARGFQPESCAFEGLDLEYGEHGVPILLSGTIGYLVCRPEGHIDSGDHHIFTATVVDGKLTSDVSPMLHVRKSGSHY
jgi:flavin reductase (DIM6/NTAB) family NADH-FMN oxidoreductase RutF